MSDGAQEMKLMQQFVSTYSRILQKITNAITKSIELYSQNAAQLEFCKWLKKGNVPEIYVVKGADEFGAMSLLKKELNEAGILYQETAEGDRICIKPEDRSRVAELNEMICLRRSNHYASSDIGLYEKAYAKIDHDARMIMLKGLSLDEEEMLISKCSNSFTIGKQEYFDEEGNVTSADVETHSSKILLPLSVQQEANEMDKVDFCKAYLQTQMALYGPNCDIERKNMAAFRDVERELLSTKGQGETRYIIGDNDPTEFIEVNAQGMQYYRCATVQVPVYAQNEAGEYILNSDGEKILQGYTTHFEERPVGKFISIDDPDYDAELESKLMKMQGNDALGCELKIKHSIAEIGTYFAEKNAGNTIDTVRQTRLAICDVNTEIVDTIDLMIKDRIQREKIEFNTEEEAFNFYQKEASGLLKEISRENGEPNRSGYNAEELKSLQTRAKESGAGTRLYSSVSVKVADYQIGQHKVRSLTREDREISRY